MTDIVIGIDPDSSKSGVALYEDGKLTYLASMSIITFLSFLEMLKEREKEGARVLIVIEDVIANGFMYSRNSQFNKSKNARIAQNVGMCKQAQKNLEEMIKQFKFRLVRVPPKASNFCKNKKMFEQVTGWTESSNQDTRSAAYFGWLYAERAGRILDEHEQAMIEQ